MNHHFQYSKKEEEEEVGKHAKSAVLRERQIFSKKPSAANNRLKK